MPIVEVVGEEDDQIERRRIGPLQVLQHDQHRGDGRAVGEQPERLLKHPEPRDRRPPKLSERTQRVGERLVREVRADKIDRTPDQDLASVVAGPCRELGRQPRLPDARLPCDEHGHAATAPRMVQSALELPELTLPSDEDLGGASLHLGQYPAALQ